jgi:hypothetical protein
MKSRWRQEADLLTAEWSRPGVYLELARSSALVAGIFLILYIGYDFSTALAAEHFLIDTTLHFDKIQWGNSDGWYSHAVKRTFISGAILVAIFYVLPLLIYYLFRKSLTVSVRRLLLVTSLVSGAILMHRLGMMPLKWNYNIGYFGAYMYYSKSTSWAITIFGTIIYISSTFLYIKPLLQTATNKETVQGTRARRNFLFMNVSLPIFFGWLITLIVQLPYNSLPISGAFMFMFVHSVFIWRLPSEENIRLFKSTESSVWEFVPFAILGLIILAYRTVFTWGVDMGIFGQMFNLY